ncbi:MAG: metal ABC transporter substrate-binding protein [Anaerolineales bacterium]
MKSLFHLISVVVLMAMLAACAAPNPTPQSSARKLRVVATTTIVGDVVANVAGDAVELSVLLPVGADPHSFSPTPQDVAKVSQADLVFANGAGLEEFLNALLESGGAKDKTFAVSEGIQLVGEQAGEHTHEGEQAGEHTHEGEQTDEHAHEHSGGDPHVWFDPNLVIIWVQNVTKVLSEKDPQNADLYQKNAAAYTAQLQELDKWIRTQVESIPPENRKIVSDHLSFTYFATRYGFTQVGAVLPGFSTLAQPSAQDIAALEDAIRQLGAKAIFVGTTVNPNLSQRIAEDTGVKLVSLYTGSLSEKGGPADTYLNFMRYNVSTIVDALK